MDLEAETSAVEVPDPADIRLRLARGRGLVIPLDETVSMPTATAAARRLHAALQPDVTVFVSGKGRGPVLTALQLVNEAEAVRLRPAVESLIAEFRVMANALVGQMEDGSPSPSDLDTDCPDSVLFQGATWHLHPHGEHCRLENAASGEVVEANIDAPEVVDPYFLLQYAETSGRHGVVVDACVEGFHDMCRLLDSAGISYG